MSPTWLCIVFLVIQLGDCYRSQEIGCRDENNNIVDWFYMYKLPKNKFTRNSLIQNGVAYLYITPQTIKKGWTLSDKAINATNSMPGITLNVLYKNKTNSLSLIYNDQWESKEKVLLNKIKRSVKIVDTHVRNAKAKKIKYKKKTGGGHTKGVIISDATNGVWIIHSVPKYPPLPDDGKYSYPDNAKRYGQSFLCLSLNASQINVVGKLLQYNEPKILSSKIPDLLRERYSNIISVVEGRTVKEPPWFDVTYLQTRGKTTFLSFGKSGNYNDDLYEGLVAPTLSTDLLVETWRNGPGVLPSNCTYKYKVNNIDKIAFNDKNIAFSSHSDHSKWAVSALEKNCKKKCSTDRWVCVGDINRAEAQEGRGGGTVCLNNADLWKHYSGSINSIQSCDGKVSERFFISY